MQLEHTRVVVTGGSRGLGLGLVEALVDAGADVTAVARDAVRLAALRARLGIETIAADAADPGVAARILGEVKPGLLVLNAGATPAMGALDQLRWEDFARTWEVDVRAGFHWLQAALRMPLQPNSRVLVASSGAAVGGSPLSGGYAGAKRMLWFMAKYANGIAKDRHLGIQFQALVLRQMILDTGIGDAGAHAYAATLGITPAQFVTRFGAALSPRAFGERIVAMLQDARYAQAGVLALSGDAGVSIMDEAAA